MGACRALWLLHLLLHVLTASGPLGARSGTRASGATVSIALSLCLLTRSCITCLQDAATAVESLVVDGSGSDGSARISVDRVDVDRRVAMAAHKLLNESGVTAGPAGAAAMHALSGGEGESVRATLGLSGTSDVVVVSTDGELTDSRGR